MYYVIQLNQKYKDNVFQLPLFKLYLFYYDYKQAQGAYTNAFVGTDGGIWVVLSAFVCSFSIILSSILRPLLDFLNQTTSD